jgi:proton-dependent oligopeptide transporter, POT family
LGCGGGGKDFYIFAGTVNQSLTVLFMFKNHPKGLIVAFFANMGERFGYYTMIAIFTLYLQARFGWNATETGKVYGGFLFGVYFLPLLGGILADKLLGYGRTILIGIVIMFLGYTLLAVPGKATWFIYAALAVISLGTGFFKGNLQALVGNLYDDPKYSKYRDTAFTLFYMGINIGAFFAPYAATSMSNYIMKLKGFTDSQELMNLASRFRAGDLADSSLLEQMARSQMADKYTDLAGFVKSYFETLSASYNAGFALAAGAMIISLIIFIAFRKHYKHADITHRQMVKESREDVVVLTRSQTTSRLIALGLVFVVVIFFWMAFHQNGFTLTIFAKNYTNLTVNQITASWFNLKTLLPLIALIFGLVMALSKENEKQTRLSGWILAAAGIIVGYFTFNTLLPEGNQISVQIFQSFNPLFIVMLTPLVLAFFSFLRAKGIEPSSPKKIGIGMLITSIGFLLMCLVAVGLPSYGSLHSGVSPILVSPYWLIGNYFMLTIAELFLSPIGISFVSKVAPPQFKGFMQGGWFAATAVGNLLAGLIGVFFDSWELWQFFALLVGMALLSATFIFSVMKRLERATKS